MTVNWEYFCCCVLCAINQQLWVFQTGFMCQCIVFRIISTSLFWQFLPVIFSKLSLLLIESKWFWIISTNKNWTADGALLTAINLIFSLCTLCCCYFHCMVYLLCLVHDLFPLSSSFCFCLLSSLFVQFSKNRIMQPSCRQHLCKQVRTAWISLYLQGTKMFHGLQ